MLSMGALCCTIGTGCLPAEFFFEGLGGWGLVVSEYGGEWSILRCGTGCEGRVRYAHLRMRTPQIGRVERAGCMIRI